MTTKETSAKPSDGDEPSAQDMQALLDAKPVALPGLMLHGRQIRRVYFPAIGEQRIVWRKAYCLTEAEAIEEADRFFHAAQDVISQIVRMAKARAQHARLKSTHVQYITHWTEHLSPRAYKCVMKVLHLNPSCLTAAAAQKLVCKSKEREQLVAALTPIELVSLIEALNIDL